MGLNEIYEYTVALKNAFNVPLRGQYTVVLGGSTVILYVCTACTDFGNQTLIIGKH